MKHVLLALQNYLTSGATRSEEDVLKYMIEHPKTVTGLSIRELGKKGYCSPSTIIRICQKLGFEGFKDLRSSLIAELAYRKTLPADRFNEAATLEVSTRSVFHEDMEALHKTYELLDYEIIKDAAQKIIEAPVVHLFGIGASYIVMEDLMMKMARIGKPALLFEDLHLQLVCASGLKKDDLAILCSYSGQTEEMIKCAKAIRRNGGTVISLTRFDANDLSALADLNLFVASVEDNFRIGARSSRICQMALVDCLFQAVLNLNLESGMEHLHTTAKLLEKPAPPGGHRRHYDQDVSETE